MLRPPFTSPTIATHNPSLFNQTAVVIATTAASLLCHVPPREHFRPAVVDSNALEDNKVSV
jgi:hypothetical protein